jgi:TRAP-type C4-dicarboxylate transport system permease small subunit
MEPEYMILKKSEEWFLVVSLSAMSILAFYQVVTRYVFTSLALPWIEELVRYLFVAITFIGAAVVTRKKAHPGIEILSQLMPSKMKPYHQLYTDICSLIFSLVASYVTLHLILKQKTIAMLTPAIRVPMFYVTIPMAIGLILIAYYVIRDLIAVVGNLITGGCKKQ